jgi:signal recognition particle subunit SEC65
MSFLENKIKDNKDFFDESVPSEGHKQRFIEKLENLEQPETARSRWGGILKIASVAAAFLGLAYFIFWYSIEDLGGMVIREVTQISFSAEIEDVFTYYEALAISKVEKIDQVAINTEQADIVKIAAKKQLENLDANLAEIEKEYAKNPENKALKAALVNNKRKKAEVMDNIIQQLDQSKQNIENERLTNP